MAATRLAMAATRHLIVATGLAIAAWAAAMVATRLSVVATRQSLTATGLVTMLWAVAMAATRHLMVATQHLRLFCPVFGSKSNFFSIFLTAGKFALLKPAAAMHHPRLSAASRHAQNNCYG